MYIGAYTWSAIFGLWVDLPVEFATCVLSLADEVGSDEARTSVNLRHLIFGSSYLCRHLPVAMGMANFATTRKLQGRSSQELCMCSVTFRASLPIACFLQTGQSEKTPRNTRRRLVRQHVAVVIVTSENLRRRSAGSRKRRARGELLAQRGMAAQPLASPISRYIRPSVAPLKGHLATKFATSPL